MLSKFSQQTAGRLPYAHCRRFAGFLKAAEAAKKKAAVLCACVQRSTLIQLCCCCASKNTKLLLLPSRILHAQPRAPGAGSRAAARLGRIAGDGATSTRHQDHSCSIFQVILLHNRLNFHPSVPQALLDPLSRRCMRWERFAGFCAVLHEKHRHSSAAVRYPASHIYLSANFMTMSQIVR